jgi:hypothetical protein
VKASGKGAALRSFLLGRQRQAPFTESLLFEPELTASEAPAKNIMARRGNLTNQ